LLSRIAAPRRSRLSQGRPSRFVIPILRGRDGRDGEDGRHGKDGLPGRDGKDGEPGKDGAPGQVGPRGAPGSHDSAAAIAVQAVQDSLRVFKENTQNAVDQIREEYRTALSQHDDSIEQRFSDLKKHLEHEVAAIVVGLFIEYKVLDRTGRPIGSTEEKASSAIRKVPGSAEQTKIQICWCGNISLDAPI